jgi:hypothetical protein
MGELVLFDSAKGSFEADGALQRIPGYQKKVEPIILDGLVRDRWPKFLHSWPLSDKYFLVSAQPHEGANWGIYLVDIFDNMLLLKELQGYALLEPIPILPRTKPPPLRYAKILAVPVVYSGRSSSTPCETSVPACRRYLFRCSNRRSGNRGRKSFLSAYLKDFTAKGRVEAVREQWPKLREAGIRNVLVDTCVLDLATLGQACSAIHDIKDEFGLPVGIGVLGCGFVGRGAHVPALADMDGAKLVAIADADAARRTKTAAKYQIAASYDHYEQLVADPRVDVVVVALPTPLHVPASLAAIEAGKHVLCEMPLALTLEDADRLIEAARAAGVEGTVWHDRNGDGVRGQGDTSASEWTVFQDLNHNGHLDVQVTTVRSSDVGQFISYSTPFVSQTLVTGTTGRIVVVDMHLDIAHTAVGDLEIGLLSPSGTLVKVLNNVGGTGNNFAGTNRDERHTAVQA